MKKRHSEEQIVRILRDMDTNAVAIGETCMQHNITERTLHRWRSKYAGLDETHARRLRQLEIENARLKRVVAEQMLVIDALSEFGRKHASVHARGNAAQG